ncbi:uncharacterized protein LOC117589794 [Drosophila guanche]|uniref:Uncharacterized protein n=1 Tax=Drosophila guanche TaxID=7266 RepID=A0A3B0KHY2_DROGU|nr:uncharacterized protein LOC117589794 [Drosophila guanche]SPP88080.1 Hypothetical predicted protein [Drosophila guanche]
MAVNFLCDIVVCHLELPHTEISEPKHLQVAMRIGKVPLSLTASCINVREFTPTSQTEFKDSAKALRETLEANGLPITVRLAASTLGSGKVELPQDFTDRISEQMGDVMFGGSCELRSREGVVGTVEVMLRLTIKCEDPAVEPDTGSKRRATCVNLGPSINQQDIMFMIGSPERCEIPSDPCDDQLEPEPGDKRLQLDLSRYRSSKVNSRVDYDEPEPQEKSYFGCLRQLTEQYGGIIQSVVERVKDLKPSPCMVRRLEEDSPSRRMSVHAQEERTIPVPLGDTEELDIKPIRFCPVCLHAMSWLPKYAACHSCGTKPMPVLGQRHTVELTADEIIEEQLRKGKGNSGNEDFCLDPCDKKEQHGDGCRASCCTCTSVKKCVRCRIRKLCEDLFQPQEKPEKECPKQQTGQDFAVVTDPPENCRPYLTRVFSELINLYQINDARKAQELQARCTQSMPTMPRPSKRKFVEEQAATAMHKGVSVGALKERHKSGHKKCLSGDRVVPRRHGWGWMNTDEARKHGWRPGVIARSTSRVMKFFMDQEAHRSGFSVCRELEEKNKQMELQSQSVLSVCKRNHEIFVTLRPLSTLGVEQHPITFRIVKSELARALSELKRHLKSKGFEKCTCHQTLMLCTCRSPREKRLLERAIDKECRRRVIEPCSDRLILTDTSDSEMEFDFDVTPPAGTHRQSRTQKRTFNHGTQTSKKDKLPPPPLYPIQQNPYWRAFDCGVGDRYMGTAIGDNLETVFEDGVFGYLGGGQHGEAPLRRHPRVWGTNPGAPLRLGRGRNEDNFNRFSGTAWRGLARRVIRKMRIAAKNK